jgi:hypothetical protein
VEIPPQFERREVSIPRGESFVPDDGWDGAIVVVEEGELELVGRHGETLRVGAGGVMWFSGSAPCSLRNPGSISTVLSGVRRVPSPPCA